MLTSRLQEIGSDGKIHDALERKIERLPIPEEEIDTINLARSSSEFVKEIIQKIRWIYKPELALLEAVRASADNCSGVRT